MSEFDPIVWVGMAIGVLVAAYALGRVVAIAWFRTRREHAHRLMREMEERTKDE